MNRRDKKHLVLDKEKRKEIKVLQNGRNQILKRERL